MIKLTERERGYIKSAACFGGDQIDKVVASIQRENPVYNMMQARTAGENVGISMHLCSSCRDSYTLCRGMERPAGSCFNGQWP